MFAKKIHDNPAYVVENDQPWMVLAREDLKLDWKEIRGKRHNPRIVECFELTGYGSLPDEIAWCGVWLAAKLMLSGYVPPHLPAWARHYSGKEYGLKLKEPAYGCIVNVERNAPGGDSHVFFAEVWTDTHIRGPGGNQGNDVTNSTWFKRSDVISYTMPKLA